MNSQSSIDPKPKRQSRLATYKAGTYTDMPETGFKIVGLDELIENPDNERKVFRDMDGLIETVKSSGVIEPLTVQSATGGKFMIITGHRRFRAAKAAGLEELPVIIGDPEETAALRRKSIVSNVQRENVGPIEMAEGLRALLDEDVTIKSQRQLASAIGKRESWVSDMLRILSLPLGLQKKLRSTEVSVPYDSLMRIARLESQTDQTRLIAVVLGGATQREIRDQIDQIKGKKPASKSEDKPKPKSLYSNHPDAIVVLQSKTTKKLTGAQRIAVLNQALNEESAKPKASR